MRASNTSSVSLRTYSKTAKAEKCGQLYMVTHAQTASPVFLNVWSDLLTKINQSKVKVLCQDFHVAGDLICFSNACL